MNFIDSLSLYLITDGIKKIGLRSILLRAKIFPGRPISVSLTLLTEKRPERSVAADFFLPLKKVSPFFHDQRRMLGKKNHRKRGKSLTESKPV